MLLPIKFSNYFSYCKKTLHWQCKNAESPHTQLQQLLISQFDLEDELTASTTLKLRVTVILFMLKCVLNVFQFVVFFKLAKNIKVSLFFLSFYMLKAIKI